MQDPIAEIGYLLQSRPSEDPAVQVRVARRLYPTIHRLGLIAFGESSLARQVARQAVSQVVARLDAYRLGADFREWSLMVAIREFQPGLRQPHLWPEGNRSPSKESQSRDVGPGEPRADQEATPGAVQSLDPESRLALALRYLENLPLPAIARALGRRQGAVITLLDQACLQLHAARDPSTQPGSPTPTGTAQGLLAEQAAASDHTATRRWLQANSPSADPQESRVAKHIASCEACQSYHRFLATLPGWLAGSYKDLTIRPEELEADVSEIAVHSRSARIRFIRRRRVGEVFWVGLAMTVIIAIAWISNRLNLSTRIALPVGTPTPIEIPAPIEPGEAGARAHPRSIGVTADYVDISWDPFISSDGRSIAFTSFLDTLVLDDTNHTQDVFILERETGQVERVSVGSDGSQAAGDSFVPGMSADGRFVVFNSLAGNLVPGDTGVCPWAAGEAQNCPDVFLRDLDYQTTEWISRGWDGSASDGASYLPVISKDGSTIAFWSAAGNLVPGDDEICGEGMSQRNCLDIFIYERKLGRMERVPVGKNVVTATDFSLIPLSISGDGRLLLFPVFVDDRLGNVLPLENRWDLFLYDRLTATFEPVNVASDGTPGDAPSYSGQVSQDGRWVAFASSATNLVPGDDNGNVDIFVRDRKTGTTELVSLIPTQDGRFDSQGITGGERFFELPQISADGRWVMFMSDATNLDPELEIDCKYPPTCYILYLHDRRTGRTQLITTVATRFFPFAHLSSDGRWVVFNGDSEACLSLDLCTAIYVSDLAAHETQLQKIGQTLPKGVAGSWREIARLGGSDGWATGVAFSPDGRWVASSSNDGLVRLWDTRSWEQSHDLIGGGKALNDVRFSPDGSVLGAGSTDGKVYLWRFPAGNLGGVLEGHPGVVRSIAFSPDGAQLAVSALRVVWVWDLESGVVIQQFEYPDGYVKQVTFSPDGDYLAVAAGDKSVWIVSASSGELQLRLGGHDGQINDVAFSPDGSLLVTGSEDRTANLWELDLGPGAPPTARLLQTMVHNDWVSGTRFSPDGRLLALGSYDGNLSLWDVGEMTLEDVLLRRSQNQVLRIMFSPDGSRLAGSTVRGEVHVMERILP